MSSFRDKLNSKLNINNPKPAQQKITSFDQTWLKINVVGGQTQLCPIKLNCSWTVANVTQKPPELACKWFNKTENSMNLIQGVTGSYYQPSLADVATIIHVQCVPFIQGVQYEGMPIIKEIGPIKIDPETQQQANELLSAKKAIFSIKMKNSDPLIAQSEALIKIQDLSFKIVQKLQDQQKSLISTQIREDNLVVVASRIKLKQLQITSQGTEKLLVELANNKIRDVFVLLLKLLAIKSKQKQEMVENESPQVAPQTQIYQFNDKSTNLTTVSQQNISMSKFQTNQSQYIEDKVIVKKESEPEEPVKSKQNQALSEENLSQEVHTQNSKGKKSSIMEIKSSEDLSITNSPSSKKKGLKVQQVSHPTGSPPAGKQNALQILQITDLKKQLRANQSEINKLNKLLSQKNEQIENLKEQINRMKERESNLSCNFFQLQDQVKKMKMGSEKASEEVSYYKNENRILKNENENAQRKIKSFMVQIHDLQTQLAPFMNKQVEENSQVETYKQLKEKYDMQSVALQEFETKYLYMKQQAGKVEQKQMEMKQMLEKMEEQKNFYKKKYENITEELQSNPLSSYNIHSPIKNAKSMQQKSFSHFYQSESPPLQMEMKKEDNQKIQLDQYERQILNLKKNLKDMIEENNFLRSVNAASSKDKKSSSKHLLKAELVEMKKIVNRLTEAVTQKDIALENIKIVNRQISQKLLQAEKRLLQEECKQKGQNSRIKKVNA